MNQTRLICLLGTILISFPIWAEEDEVYLEGVSILGNQKSAYLSMRGDKVTVREGDAVGAWQVTHIKENAISLITKQGESTELPLHSRLPTISEEEPAEEEPTPEPEEAETESDASQPEEAAEIPQGHHKVRTPFGEFVVPNEENTVTSAALPKKSETSETSAPTGYRKIQTPFGNFVVEEKKVGSQNVGTSENPIK